MQKIYTHRILMIFVLMAQCVHGASSSSSALTRRSTGAGDTRVNHRSMSDIIACLRLKGDAGLRGFEAFQARVLESDLTPSEADLAFDMLKRKNNAAFVNEDDGYPGDSADWVYYNTPWTRLIRAVSERAHDEDFRVKVHTHLASFMMHKAELQHEAESNCCEPKAALGACVGASAFFCLAGIAKYLGGG